MHDIDIKEDYLLGLGNGILDTLLLDRTTGENIIWATDDYDLWTPTADKVEFPEGKTWQEYVSMGVLEITCGEAPFLASRYDTVTVINTTMTKYSEFIKQGNEVCYNGIKVMVDEVLDYSFEEIPTKAELDKTPNLFYAGIVYEDQSTETVPITKLVPLRHVTGLTEKELIKLKKQIHPGSFFLGDYGDTLGVERKELSVVCDCYIEALESESQYEWLTKDTPENFAEYCMDYYCCS